jgi:predicted unusual protein kinase regulating ubiquinone biosynthesis (AarF/ABC1/UbiB family)
MAEDLPRSAAARTAKLASLPLGAAGRVAAGWGKRLTGRSAEEVQADVAARTAEQVFAVLGELKGGAMKFGQALSIFEAAIPNEVAEPYRDALTKLQAAAPPMPASTVHRVLAEQLGRSWRQRFADFDDTPAAAASIGQVHRAVWHDGREVAVKVQYPGADEALRSDLRQLQRFSRLFQAFAPGLEVRPLLNELRDRMVEELDYRDEADHRVGRLLAEFHYSAPARARLLQADPHPGNFMLLADGRLCVIDFGAVARLPDGVPRVLGVMTRLAVDRRGEELLELARAEGFIRPGTRLLAEDMLAYLSPFTEPLRTETFRFSRRWLQSQAERVGDLRSPDFRTGRSLNLPPQYLLIHRVTAGSTGVLCQLDAEVPARAIVERWQPGFGE